MAYKIGRARVEGYAYCVNKLRQNVALETWIWSQIVTSQTAHFKYKWPPCATQWNLPMKIFSVCHWICYKSFYSKRCPKKNLTLSCVFFQFFLQALEKNKGSTSGRPIVPLFHKISGGHGIAFLNGEFWKSQRTFGLKALRG